MVKTTADENSFREYIESAESVEALLDAEEVELTMPSPQDRESRVTVRLNSDDIKLIDRMCDILGVGRSTFLRMAARVVAISSLAGIKEGNWLPFLEAAATTEAMTKDDNRKPA